jgi:hypothetical protein
MKMGALSSSQIRLTEVRLILASTLRRNKQSKPAITMANSSKLSNVSSVSRVRFFP